MRMSSTDAGAILRFLDIYEHMEGGKIDLALKGGAEGPMTGQVDARDFELVERADACARSSRQRRPATIEASTRPSSATSIRRASTSSGATRRSKKATATSPSNGVLRGPLLGSSFQGTLYDKEGNMDMTGTFMPAYGLNRIFGELPLIGVMLGNGRDRGLIGVTFKLEGDAD